MKKYILLSFTFILLVGCNQTSISLEQAKQIALDYTKLLIEDVNFTSSKLDKDDNEYDLTFHTDTTTYEVEVDAKKGTIVSIKETKLPINNNLENSINADIATQIALDHANVSIDEAVITQVEFDTENFVYYYEIEFIAKGLKYEYEINAVTSEVIKHSMESFN